MVMSWNPNRKRNVEAKVVFTHLYELLEAYPEKSIVQLFEDIIHMSDGSLYWLSDSEFLARVFDYENKIGYHTHKIRRSG
jgi:hypothetical protein